MHSLYSLIVCIVLLFSSSVNANAFKNVVYDASIKKWSGVYTPEYPWYWNKAQLIAESNLNTNAISPVGAKGLGQFMPNTWKDMERQLGWKGSEYNSSLNIQAQAYYMRNLRRQFKAPRPEKDKHSLALASYNAGLGNILKAQRYENSLLYAPMINNLHRVTGHHHRETKQYVIRIWNYIDRLEKVYG